MQLEMEPHGILCAIDVNDIDQDVIDLAAEFAKQAQIDLDLLHVTQFPDPTISAWPASLGSPTGIIEDNRRLRKITANQAGVKMIHHHLSGLPSEKILQFIERNNPRMLVMGTHGRRGLARILGSVASAVMRRATCPVLVFRQRQNRQDVSKCNEKQSC